MAVDQVDFMAVGAHPDDIELGCGGTLLRLAAFGKRGVIVDMTDASMGTRGTPEIRAKEAKAAAKVLGAERVNLGLPDGRLADGWEAQKLLIDQIRIFRPKVVITHHWREEHPDHETTSRIVKQAVYKSGLAKLDCPGKPHRPGRLFYFLGVELHEPSFCVDITPFWDAKNKAVLCYKSQFHHPGAKAFKGKSTDALIASCIFIACRRAAVPRTFKEINALTQVTKKDIGRTFKALEKFFAHEAAVKARAGGASHGKFASEFKKETDRAAVILGAAQLDLALFQLLDAHFLPVTSGKDELLDGDSPLATFSARINICYRIGLIDAEVARALHLARRIRNSFAHEVSSASLDSGSNRDRIRELISPFAQNWALQTLIEKYFDGHETPGAQFRACIALLSLRIDGAVEIAKRVDSSRAMGILPPDKVSEVEADPSMSAPEAAT